MPPALGSLEMPAWERCPGRGLGWAGPRSSSRRGEKQGFIPSLQFSMGLVGREVPYFFGFLGEISMAGPGAGMSMGNMSTHISRRPCKVEEVQSAPLAPPCPLHPAVSLPALLQAQSGHARRGAGLAALKPARYGARQGSPMP